MGRYFGIDLAMDEIGYYDLRQTASPTFVARRQTELHFSAIAMFDLSHLAEGMQAGITAYFAPLNHYDVIVEKRNGRLFIKSNVR